MHSTQFTISSQEQDFEAYYRQKVFEQMQQGLVRKQLENAYLDRLLNWEKIDQEREEPMKDEGLESEQSEESEGRSNLVEENQFLYGQEEQLNPSESTSFENSRMSQSASPFESTSQSRNTSISQKSKKIQKEKLGTRIYNIGNPLKNDVQKNFSNYMFKTVLKDLSKFNGLLEKLCKNQGQTLANFKKNFNLNGFSNPYGINVIKQIFKNEKEDVYINIFKQFYKIILRRVYPKHLLASKCRISKENKMKYSSYKNCYMLASGMMQNKESLIDFQIQRSISQI